MRINERTQTVIQGIIDQFESGDIPDAITIAMFPFSDIPSENWSLCNRLLMAISGTMDARGYKQWQAVDRFVKKGSKAIHIMVPYIRKVEDNGQEKTVLAGFGLKPVFRIEDTDGEAIEYPQIDLPELPFIERAGEWGINVKPIAGNHSFYGYYCPSQKEIALATPSEKTFFHELAHAAHEKVSGGLKRGQDPLQEIIAELSAAVICRLTGKRSDTLGNSYQYIKRYAEKISLSPHQACLKVLTDTDKVLGLIMNGENQLTA
jgi:hypothetical protein